MNMNTNAVKDTLKTFGCDLNSGDWHEAFGYDRLVRPKVIREIETMSMFVPVFSNQASLATISLKSNYGLMVANSLVAYALDLVFVQRTVAKRNLTYRIDAKLAFDKTCLNMPAPTLAMMLDYPHLFEVCGKRVSYVIVT